MKLRWTLVLVAGCGHAPPAATPTPANEQKIVDAAAAAAVECFPDNGTSLTPPLPDGQPPSASFVDNGTVRTGAYWFCDLPDRVVLVDHTRDPSGVFAGDVVSIPRSNATRLTHARIAASSSCTDPCGSDGWAGCSLQETCALTSTLAGAKAIATVYPTESPFGAVQSVDGAACAPMTDQGVMAVCATTTRSIFVRSNACNGDDQTSPTEWDLVGLVYDAGAVRAGPDAEDAPAPTHTITGGLPTSDGSSWTYGFGDDGALVFDLGPSPRATFTYDGTTEDCFAFAINPY